MIKALLKPGGILIFAVAVIHIIWGVGLWVSPAKTTGIDLIWRICKDHYLAGCVFIACSYLAIIALAKNYTNILGICMLFPQQLLLTLSAISVIKAVAVSSFADGIIHPRSFIFQDQEWVIVVAFFHAVSIALWRSLQKITVIATPE